MIYVLLQHSENKSETIEEFLQHRFSLLKFQMSRVTFKTFPNVLKILKRWNDVQIQTDEHVARKKEHAEQCGALGFTRKISFDTTNKLPTKDPRNRCLSKASVLI